jgi:hypothetical protein
MIGKNMIFKSVTLSVFCFLLAGHAGAMWNDFLDSHRKDQNSAAKFIKMNIGGLEFYDFKNDEIGRQIKKWSSNAPAWRSHAQGANLIGICRNSSCKANGKKVVCGIGYGTHLIAENGAIKITVHCPMCNETIVPKTCAFNNCHFQVLGKKKTTGTRVITEWKHVGDECLLFDESENTDYYISLKIKCQLPNGPLPDDDI